MNEYVFSVAYADGEVCTVRNFDYSQTFAMARAVKLAHISHKGAPVTCIVHLCTNTTECTEEVTPYRN